MVDNASTGADTRAALAHLEAAGRAAVVRLAENTGFARGMNAGYAVARGEHLVFLNCDVELHPSFVAEAVAALDRSPEVGVVAPHVERVPAEVERFWEAPGGPFPLDGVVVALAPFTLRVRDAGAPAHPQRSFKPNGACPVVRRALVEDLRATFGVGPFDPVFDTYGEDVDAAFKAWSRRWATRYCPAVRAGHVRSYASSIELPDKRGRLRVNLVAERYVNALRHLPLRRLLPVLAVALADDAALLARQRRKGDAEAWPDVLAAWRRVWALRAALVAFRRRHRTWRTVDFRREVFLRGS